MDKKKIYNYVMNSPHNTNPNILSSLLNEPTSWNDLSDKPFYEETTTVGGDTLTWDGNTEGLYVAMGAFYRVSDIAPDIEHLTNGVRVKAVSRGKESEEEASDVQNMGVVYMVYSHGNGGVLIATNDAEVEGTQLLKGTYFMQIGNTFCVSSITIPGYTGFETTTTVVKPIETKYLPEHLQFGEEKAFEPIVWDASKQYETIEIDGGVNYRVAEFFEVTDGMIDSATTVIGGETMNVPATAFGQVFGYEHGWEFAEGMVVASDGQLTFMNVILPEGVWVCPLAESGASYLAFTPKSTVKPLDEKYMPILTSPSGKKFKLSVDDSGVISTTEV